MDTLYIAGMIFMGVVGASVLFSAGLGVWRIVRALSEDDEGVDLEMPMGSTEFFTEWTDPSGHVHQNFHCHICGGTRLELDGAMPCDPQGKNWMLTFSCHDCWDNTHTECGEKIPNASNSDVPISSP